jgi:polyhydroxyalkanoate synthase
MALHDERTAKIFLEEMERYSNNLLKITQTLLETEDIELASSPKDLVFREDRMTLYRFRSDKRSNPVPLLITYALVNRETMMDLEQGRSLIANLLEQGLDIYIIQWGYPSRVDRYIELDDYIDVYMDDCVEFVRKQTGADQINLMGVCQGGTFATIYAALYPEKIRNLVTMVAPIDFDTDGGLLNVWSRDMDVDLMVDTLGNIPGDLMNTAYLMLKPFQLMIDKYIGLVNSARDTSVVANFLRMEKWIFDSPDQSGEAFRRFVKEFYKGNKLIKGELEVGGRKVNLKNISVPLLNIFAEKDHLVPPVSSKALSDLVSSKDVTTKSFAVGHIGIYVSSKSQKELAPCIANWINERSGPRTAAKPVQKAAARPARGARRAAAKRQKTV